jgi:hypothetical protein
MHAPEQGTGQAQTQALGLRSIVVSDIVTKIIEKNADYILAHRTKHSRTRSADC